MKRIRILLTGGGSGGHIFPLIAVTEALRAQSETRGATLDIRYFGDAGNFELQLVGSGIKISRITGSKLRRYAALGNIVDFFKFAWSIPQALWKVFWFMPDVAFSKGGPGAVAILNACAWYRVPIVIHDSDAIPGLTSRLTGRVAARVALGFPSAAQYFPGMKEKLRVTGNPVRRELRFTDSERENDGTNTAKSALRLTTEAPVVLIIGGSQGAETLNRFVRENLPMLLERYQIIHQVGAEQFDTHVAAVRATQPPLSADALRRYRPVAFFTTHIRDALLAADIVISRAGASAIAEIASAGKPSILVPLPNAAQDHQSENAFRYEAAGACVVIEEENLIGNLVSGEIDRLLNDADRLKKIKEHAITFYKPDAAETIARDILAVAQGE